MKNRGNKKKRACALNLLSSIIYEWNPIVSHVFGSGFVLPAVEKSSMLLCCCLFFLCHRWGASWRMAIILSVCVVGGLFTFISTLVRSCCYCCSFDFFCFHRESPMTMMSTTRLVSYNDDFLFLWRCRIKTCCILCLLSLLLVVIMMVLCGASLTLIFVLLSHSHVTSSI